MNVQGRMRTYGTEVIDSHLLLRVVRAGKDLEVGLNEALSAQGLSLARLTVLHVIADDHGPVGLRDVAAALGCAKSNASVLVDKMQRDGLLARAVNLEDKRSVQITLTAAGRTSYTEGLASLGHYEHEVFAQFSQADREALAHLTARVSR